VSSAAEQIAQARDSDEALGQFLIAMRARGYRGSALLEAAERAPRAEFVAPEHQGFAYRDISLPLPCGQETGRPFTALAAVAALGLERHHRVLEIGTGSGWRTALIASLAAAVASVERWRVLAEAADRRLARLGIVNAVVAHGDGAEGLPEAGPFDRVLFNVALEAPPSALAGQLAAGAIIVAPVLRDDGVTLTRFTAGADGALLGAELGPTDAPPLTSGIGEGG
jgi:protein-L-isoaspartate(D-aspartate) O-methyltransferase